jgi:hypothetical protein
MVPYGYDNESVQPSWHWQCLYVFQVSLAAYQSIFGCNNVLGNLIKLERKEQHHWVGGLYSTLYSRL